MSAFGRLVATSERDEIQKITAGVDEVVRDELEKTIVSTKQEAKKHLGGSAHKLASDAYESFKLKVKEKYDEDSAEYEIAVALINGASWHFYGPRSIQKELRLIMTDSDN